MCTTSTTNAADAAVGHSGFDYNSLILPKETLKAMLIRENELRLCKETQEEYFRRESKPQEPGDWLDYTAILQQQVVDEVSFLIYE
jgi:hypothetical protein